MKLATLTEAYRAPLQAQYAARLLPAHRRALDAIGRCRTPAAGAAWVRCSACGQLEWHALSCGHRRCPTCQNHEVTQWLERQREKRLPVEYFLVTFTLPSELRALAWAHQRQAYAALFAAAIATLKAFGLNPKHLGAEMGMTAVLHTHSRRLTYHPHLHVVVPGGGVDVKQGVWKRTRYRYRFNEIALAKLFRGTFPCEPAQSGLIPPAKVPKQWVVDCRHVGRGESALESLSRDRYRGVSSGSDILGHSDGQVTFRDTDNATGQRRTETLPGEDFRWRVIQHVRPRGFHRVRDDGFLHHNARKTLQRVQLSVPMVRAVKKPKHRPCFCCSACGEPMVVIGVYPGQVVQHAALGQGPPQAVPGSLVNRRGADSAEDRPAAHGQDCLCLCAKK